MAHKGIGFFDSKGQYFKSPEDATISDLASLLGRIGDGDSLAPGIAAMLLDRRQEILRIFEDHEDMKAEQAKVADAVVDESDNVSRLPSRH